jgi:hypothetical protein
MIEIDLGFALVYLIVNLFEIGIAIEPEIGVIEIGIAVIDYYYYYFEFVGIRILLN